MTAEIGLAPQLNVRRAPTGGSPAGNWLRTVAQNSTHGPRGKSVDKEGRGPYVSAPSLNESLSSRSGNAMRDRNLQPSPLRAAI